MLRLRRIGFVRVDDGRADTEWVQAAGNAQALRLRQAGLPKDTTQNMPVTGLSLPVRLPRFLSYQRETLGKAHYTMG